jgi:DNA (cytosine-5)-methyltransferase 1
VTNLRTVDLFAGCGGLSLGFISGGFDILAAYDNWKPAVETYTLNFKSHHIYDIDLSNAIDAIAHIQQWKPDIVIGGPPCQDFSHAGKRIEGKRADLTNSFTDIICGISPEWFVMENVDRAVKSKAYKSAKEKLSEAKYGLTEYVFDASLCGVPQHRKRLFCIGHKGDKPQFLLQEIQDSLANIKPMTLREYFGNSLNLEYYYRHPRNYNRRGIFSIDEPAPTVRGVNRPIPEGYLGHPRDPIRIDNNVRPLTLSERAQIQTFPKNYIWKGSKTDIEQMIGNAVPIKLAQFVSKLILNYVRNNKGGNI